MGGMWSVEIECRDMVMGCGCGDRVWGVGV